MRGPLFPNLLHAMLPPPFTDALVLTGPTGSGKTRLGIDLARRLDAEIVSMDSMALYRGMDIGTAKPSHEERAEVPHHLIDVLDPWESANVAWWLEQAKRVCVEIARRGKQVLFVGGTPLYLKALLFGLFDGPPADAQVRQRLQAEIEIHGAAALHRRLALVDPATAARLHPNDARRIIRALEVHELTGRPISEQQTQWASLAGATSATRIEAMAADGDRPADRAIVWLDLPRPELHERIERRVEAMFETGLIDEVRRLGELERPLSKEARQALGYKEVLAYLDGTCSLADAIATVKTRTRQFAKRQVTWFRHLPGCVPATSRLTWDLWKPRM